VALHAAGTLALFVLQLMKALVPQFQEEITFGQKKTERLLGWAQLISSKLELTDIAQWIIRT